MLALWVLMLVYEKMTKAADILGPSSNCIKISGLRSLLQFWESSLLPAVEVPSVSKFLER